MKISSPCICWEGNSLYGLFDTHCDTVCKAYDEKGQLFNCSLQLNLKQLLQYNAPVQFFAIWLNKKYYANAYAETVKRIEYYYEQTEKNKDIFAHANSYSDIVQNKKDGKISGILSVEGGEAIEGKLENLYSLYSLGVRAMTLTWNYKNEIGNGAGEATGGLTDFGREVVAEMEKMGMLVDVSHLNDDSFWDVAKIAKKPFIASHSNCRKITNVRRNLTDAQMKAIANSGGVIGINLCPIFLSNKLFADTNDVITHIDHMIKVVGSDHIGFGCDFDGIDDTPSDITDISCINNVIYALDKKYGSSVATKIAEGNFLRLLCDNS